MFTEKNRTLQVILTDGKSMFLRFGTTAAPDGVFNVPSNVLPWYVKVGYYYIELQFNGVRVARSNRFTLAANAQIACDDFSLASVFSSEVYEEIDEVMVYKSCGVSWKTLYAYNWGDNAAMVVASDVKKLAILSFRGTTQSLSDWMNTLSVVPVSCTNYLAKGCSGGYLHQGFAHSFNDTRNAMRIVANALVKQGYRLLLTGHSKGAAIAAIQATDLLQLYPGLITPKNLRLATFGQPRTGDAYFAATLNALLPRSKCNSVRFIGKSLLCGKDPVAMLPPRGLWEHAGEPVTLSCSSLCFKKREALGLAVKCHLMNNYIDEVIGKGQGHAAC